MKTTIEVRDELLARAKRYARRRGQPLRAVIEEGLRRVLGDNPLLPRFRLPDRSVGKAGAADPLDKMSWQDLRGEIYGDTRRS